jgi:hypothetical protein
MFRLLTARNPTDLFETDADPVAVRADQRIREVRRDTADQQGVLSGGFVAGGGDGDPGPVTRWLLATART